jgi:hypothetical protein
MVWFCEISLNLLAKFREMSRNYFYFCINFVFREIKKSTFVSTLTATDPYNWLHRSIVKNLCTYYLRRFTVTAKPF